MSDEYNDGYQEGARGAHSTGSTVLESIGYSAGKADRERSSGGGGWMFTALLLAPLICAAYPIAGFATAGTLILVPKVVPWIGIKPSSGVGWLLAFGLALVAFFLAFAVERRLSRRKWYRVLRDAFRLLLVPALAISMLLGKGIRDLSAGSIVFAIILVPVGFWFLKRLDRVFGTAGE